MKDYLKFSKSKHVFQASQQLYTCYFDNGTSRILCFDDDNNHWLDPANDMDEVGYNSDCRINNQNLKIMSVTHLIT